MDRRNIYWWAALAGIIAAVLACCGLLVATGAWLFPFSPTLLTQATPTQTESVALVPPTRTPTLTNTPLPPEPEPPTPTNTPEPPTSTVTATPHPTDTPVPEPPTSTSTPRPKPTDTSVPPTPVPTVPHNTQPGTILSMGDTWYADGIELRLTETAFYPPSPPWGNCYVVRFKMVNKSTSLVYFSMDRDQFWITDNLGRRYEMQGKFHSEIFCRHIEGYSPPIEVSIEPGAKFDYNWLDGGWSVQFYDVPITDPNVTLLTVHVSNLSRISKAEWQIPISH